MSKKIAYKDNGNIKIWSIGGFRMIIQTHYIGTATEFEVSIEDKINKIWSDVGWYVSLLKATDAGIKDIRKMLKRYKKVIEKTELALEE